MKSKTILLSAVLVTPLLAGAEGGCGGAINSMTDAPSMNGTWDITYDDRLDIEVKLGGAVYTETLPSSGGSFTIDHAGTPITFDLDCAKPEVICPSETWPMSVQAEHRNARFPHRFFVSIPRQSCDGTLVDPDTSECGAGTSNPDCGQVCDGEMKTTNTDHFGVVNEAGTAFDLLLGAGVATNGINCALLGISAAKANLETSGSSTDGDWEATGMKDGEVAVAYTGGCLWAGDPNDDGTIEALTIGAQLKFTTGFEGSRR
ncbi:MAG: hypothetical protein RMA76_29635 [Deltaproteobacteria bacterium]|jgi:hypothetical protein